MAPSTGLESDSEEHVLPGGVGTFSIRQVASATATATRSRAEAAGHGVVSGAFPPAVHVSRTEEGPPHGVAESGARAHSHSGPLAMWQDSGVDQRSRGENLYTYAVVFSSLGSVPEFRTLFYYTALLHVQAREEGRGEAAAAAPIRGPAHRDPSIPLPSSGDGQR
jgi:hypothetical protein